MHRISKGCCDEQDCGDFSCSCRQLIFCSPETTHIVGVQEWRYTPSGNKSCKAHQECVCNCCWATSRGRAQTVAQVNKYCAVLSAPAPAVQWSDNDRSNRLQWIACCHPKFRQKRCRSLDLLGSIPGLYRTSVYHLLHCFASPFHQELLTQSNKCVLHPLMHCSVISLQHYEHCLVTAGKLMDAWWDALIYPDTADDPSCREFHHHWRRNEDFLVLEMWCALFRSSSGTFLILF